jgi:hypothetical protein
LALFLIAAVLCMVLAPSFLAPKRAQAEPVTITVVSIAAFLAAVDVAAATYAASPTFADACNEVGVSTEEGYKAYLVGLGATANACFDFVASGGPPSDPGWKKTKAIAAGMKAKGTLAALTAISVTTMLGSTLFNLATTYRLLAVVAKQPVSNPLFTRGNLFMETGAVWNPAGNGTQGGMFPQTALDPAFTPPVVPGYTFAQVAEVALFYQTCELGDPQRLYRGVSSTVYKAFYESRQYAALNWEYVKEPAMYVYVTGYPASVVEVPQIIYQWQVLQPVGQQGSASWASYMGLNTNAQMCAQYFAAKPYLGIVAATPITTVASLGPDERWPGTMQVPSVAPPDMPWTAAAGWGAAAPPAAQPTFRPETPIRTDPPPPVPAMLAPTYDSLQAFIDHARDSISQLPAPFDSVIGWLVGPIEVFAQAAQSVLQWLGDVWSVLTGLPSLIWSFFQTILEQILAAIQQVETAVSAFSMSDLLAYISLPSQEALGTEVAADTVTMGDMATSAGTRWPFAFGPAIGVLMGSMSEGSFSLPTSFTFPYAPARTITVSVAQTLEPIASYRWLLVIVVYLQGAFILFGLFRPQVVV